MLKNLRIKGYRKKMSTSIHDKKNLYAYMNSPWTESCAGKAWGEAGPGWRMSLWGIKGT